MFSPPLLTSDGLRVRRMRLRGSDVDRLLARQRIEAQLRGISSASLGMPAKALLFVRRLAARVEMSSHSLLRTNAIAAVYSELGLCADRARRPWLDAEASRADVVLFADEAELVACLIRDWLRGLVADRWWWRTVLGNAGAEEWLRYHVLPRGELLVPALSLLAPRSEVVPWAVRLREADARVAAAAVAHAFSLETAATPSPVAALMGLERDGDSTGPPAGSGAASTHEADATARLTATVPEMRSPALGREQRVLLVLVCVATRAPSWGRTSQFATAMAALDRIEAERDALVAILSPGVSPARYASSEQPTDDVAAETAAPGPIDRESPANPPAAEAAALAASLPPPQRGHEVEIHLPPVPPVPVRTWSSQKRAPAPPAVGQVARNVVADLEAHASLPATAAITGAPKSEWRPADVAQPAADESRSALAKRIGTQYGGIFYLLNAWLTMGLYADFTAPRGANLALSPWDLLALVGRAWFGEPFVLDPIWSTLANLAVRAPEDEPARDFEMPDDWLDCHLETLNARLQLALGVERSSEIPGIVCRHHASIEVTASCVHVRLALCDLPLDVRVAGLDRDPGWIPAAGRAVVFHFA